MDEHGAAHPSTGRSQIKAHEDRIVFVIELDNTSDLVVENVYLPDLGDIRPAPTGRLEAFMAPGLASGRTKMCSGGIIGMGERVEDRLSMLVLLANLSSHPESVPINLWNEVKGVPVNDTAERPEPIALVRLVATARIMTPKAWCGCPLDGSI